MTDLKRRSVQGALALLAGQGGKMILQFVSLAILGRLLRPADFGLVAMVAPVVAFVALFNDLGLTQATVQRDRISDRQMSALFWITVAFSGTLALTTLGAAPMVGWFYGDPRTVPVTIVFGGLLIFNGLSAQHVALLNRRMRFEALALLELGAMAAGVATGIGAAWLTRSYWSLVAAQGVTSAATAVLAWTLSGWRPQLPRRAEGVRELLRFGGNLTGSNVVNFFARNLDNILIGKVWGDQSLGTYDRAYKLLMLPLNQISYPLMRIAIPILSRLVDEPARYRRAYLQMIEKILFVAVPGIALLVIMAPKVVLLLLGPQWGDVVPVFYWLGAGSLVGLIGNSTGWLFISQNRTSEMLRWGIVSSLIIVASFLIGLPFGPVGVAACYVAAASLIQGPLLCWAVTRKGPVQFVDIARTTATFSAAAIASCIAIHFVGRAADAIEGANDVLTLVVCLPFSYAAAAATLAVTPAGRKILGEMHDVISLARRNPFAYHQ